MTLKRITSYFSKTEIILWCSSVLLIITSFALFDRKNFFTLAASLIGVTSLIFNAKGNPAGQALMIIFSLIYGYISYSFAYYGEMITYVGMTGPMAAFALITWLRNPSVKGKAEVRVNRINRKELIFSCALTVAVTVIFYFILKAFNTASLWLSTVSVTTSFLAVYLTFRRDPHFALAYAANDIVLIALWTIAAIEDISYISVIICFIVFLINDVYGFMNWKKIEQRQNFLSAAT